MTIELSEELEQALKTKANARGLTPDLYVREIIESYLEDSVQPEPNRPFKSGLGMWANYGISLSQEEIDENRADMLRNSIFAKDA